MFKPIPENSEESQGMKGCEWPWQALCPAEDASQGEHVGTEGTKVEGNRVQGFWV